ncbi:MAG: hydroxyacid dehydrogenase [Alphaproteobacteria bacterium]|nr:hydroxyacid dehydrogenase [Alphaproteobacteria bacterium]
MAKSPARIFLTHAPTARAFWYGEAALAALRAAGDVMLNPRDEPLDPAALAEAARGCPLVVIDRQTEAPAALFERMPDLVALIRVAVDIRNIDMAAASAAGVLVTQASRGFVASVSEWIVGAMIDAGRGLTGYVIDYRAGRTPMPVKGRQIKGATVGVIGYGAIARYLVPILAAMGARVLIHDPYVAPSPPAEPAGLNDLLAQSDYVLPLAVATAETENLIDGAALGRMKPTAWLINASRGNLIDEAALERTLDARAIAGAAFDVGRAPDQMPSPHLARRPDVLASPHIAGLTPESIGHQSMETARQAAAILAGEIPAGAVNADRASRLARLRG